MHRALRSHVEVIDDAGLRYGVERPVDAVLFREDAREADAGAGTDEAAQRRMIDADEQLQRAIDQHTSHQAVERRRSIVPEQF